MAIPTLPMVPLGAARPRCDKCGAELGDLLMYGHPADGISGDITQITFQLPTAVDRETGQPRHKCRAGAPVTPIRTDADDDGADEADKPPGDDDLGAAVGF